MFPCGNSKVHMGFVVSILSKDLFNSKEINDFPIKVRREMLTFEKEFILGNELGTERRINTPTLLVQSSPDSNKEHSFCPPKNR